LNSTSAAGRNGERERESHPVPPPSRDEPPLTSTSTTQRAGPKGYKERKHEREWMCQQRGNNTNDSISIMEIQLHADNVVSQVSDIRISVLSKTTVSWKEKGRLFGCRKRRAIRLVMFGRVLSVHLRRRCLMANLNLFSGGGLRIVGSCRYGLSFLKPIEVHIHPSIRQKVCYLFLSYSFSKRSHHSTSIKIPLHMLDPTFNARPPSATPDLLGEVWQGKHWK
jgi:hypothetical protein